MRLELRVRADARTWAVTVTCPEGTAWRAVQPDLLSYLGLPPGSVCRTAGHPVDLDALVGRPPLLRGAEVVVGAADDGPSSGARRPAPPQLELAVVGGPAAGTLLPLPPGRHLVGRDPGCDLVVPDPALSRHHAVIAVSETGISLEDTGSTNGTVVDGAPLTGALPLAVGAGIRLGDSVLVVRRHQRPTAAVADGEGRLRVPVQPPRPIGVTETTLTLPAAPGSPPSAEFPWPTLLLPLLAAGILGAVLRTPMVLAFALLGPVMVLASHLGDRRRRRAEGEQARQAFDEARQTVDRTADHALAEARHVLDVRTVDAAEALRTARSRGGRLWRDGRPDALLVRLGRADLPGPVILRDPDGHGPGRRPVLTHVPVELDLVQARVAAIGGHGAHDVARTLVGCLAVTHPPGAVRIHVVAASARAAREWRWTRWLPHETTITTSSAVLAELAAQHRRRSPTTGTGVDLVVLLRPSSGQVSPHLTGLADAALEGDGRLTVLTVATEPEELPPCARAWVRLDDGRATVHLPDGATVARLVPDRSPRPWGEALASELAPLTPVFAAGTTAALPDRVDLVAVLPAVTGRADDVRTHWRRAGRGPVATLGVDASGPVVLDLVSDGPHVLVGGTTGAGKSELLQTLVATLAVSLPPDELTFLLVDYKGGAAFAECVDLPHTTGLVTDLDPHLAARALASLRAELSRRERLLRDAGIADVAAYTSRRGLDDPSLPRLVIVVDEFRMLAQELPDFVDGLLAVATIGRSLGVHLVLATQRPSGVVTPDIRANMNARIALRVRDRADSDDIVEAPDAAWISDRVPGRAVCRRGDTTLRTLQVAWAGAPDGSLEDDVTLEVDGLTAGPRRAPSGTTQLQRLVALLAEAGAGLPRARPAWLPELPEGLTPTSPLLVPPPPGEAVAMGLVDLPSFQCQDVASVDLGSGRHTAVVGTHRTGRTTALRALALAASQAPALSGRLHVHVVDGGGDLADLEELPTCGTCIGREEPQDVLRLLDRLRASCRDLHGSGIRTLLLIDRWDAVVAAADPRTAPGLQDELVSLLRDGPGCGVTVAMAGDRTLLTSSLASHLGDRLILRLSDPTDLVLCGVPPEARPTHQPPGRAVRSTDHAEVQLVHVTAADVTAAVDAVTEPRTPPVRLRPLPRAVGADEVVAHRPGTFAVGGDHADPVPVPWRESPLVVVTGPPGSGRSTALAALVAAAPTAEVGEPVLVGPGETASTGRVPWPRIGPDEADRLSALLAQRPRSLVVVDDAEQLLDTSVEQVCVEAARAALARGTTPGPTLVVAGATDRLNATFRGLAAELRRARTGLVLQPRHPSDGDLLGVAVPWLQAPPPGRGVFVHRGRTLVVQVVRHHLASRAVAEHPASGDPSPGEQGTIVG